MKNFRAINQEKKIYECEFENREEMLQTKECLKKSYPNILIKGTGYRSKKYIIHLHKDWDKFLNESVDENGCTFNCVNCNDGLCNDTKKPSWNGNRCFGEMFWSEVYEEKERHFVNSNGSVLSYTFGEGGFGNRRYTIKLENGTVIEDVGLWHRGKLPKNLENIIQKGVVL